MIVLLAWWVALFGVWPLAHPEHDLSGDLVARFDLALHFVACAWLVHYYWRNDGAWDGWAIVFLVFTGLGLLAKGAAG